MSAQHRVAHRQGFAGDNILLLGNRQTGKSALFRTLCGQPGRDVGIPTTSMTLEQGIIRTPWHVRVPGLRGLASSVFGRHVTEGKSLPRLLDTPGAATLFPHGEEEIVVRDALFHSRPTAILFVADAKNLRRSLALFTHAAAFGLPMVVALNMVDEAALQGVDVDAGRLAGLLGVPVVPCVAVDRAGTLELARKLAVPVVPPAASLELPPQVAQVLAQVEALLEGLPVAPHAVALSLLAGDPGAMAFVAEELGQQVATAAGSIARSLQAETPRPLELLLIDGFYARAEKLAAEVISRQPAGRKLLERFGRAAQSPLTGGPIAVVVVAMMYIFVGVIGATWVVDWLAANVFDAWLLPACGAVTDLLPWTIVQDAIMDPDFGMLPTGLFLAFGLVLPVLLFFYFAFAILQDSGYLARLSVLLDRMFRIVGLNGKGVMPISIGFSCVTMALITTRMLETRRERVIASMLLLLGVPCAPLLGVLMVVLGGMPVTATLAVFGMLFTQIVVAGWLANRVLPGRGTDFIMEVPPMRVPRLRRVAALTVQQTYHFMREAVPYFVLAALALFVVDRLGGLDALAEVSKPLIGGFLGLPDASVQVFIKTLIRREAGAAELTVVAPHFTNLQTVVTILVMTFLTPCVNAVLVLFKERGPVTAMALLVMVSSYAIIAGGVFYQVCAWLGFTFS